jgi:ABC-2 type transport system permease protein
VVIEVVPRVLYNPSLRTPPFMVPGVLAMLLVIVTTLVTAMGLAREREQGTLEQVLVTPIRPAYLLAGKIAPFVVIGLLDVVLVLTAGALLFDVRINGSLLLLAGATLLYLMSTLGVGLFISSVSATQQQSFLGGFLFALPAILLSGVMTPIRSMPHWLQLITYLNPLRYFVATTRSILMKAGGLADLWPNFVALAVFGVVIFTVATLRFNKQLG